MAGIANAITALVDNLITQINNRTGPGASDYQVWLAQGNTGTLADYRTAMIGSDVDYATQFNNQLGALPAAAGTATEGQAGITQLATIAEALAGTSAVKAMSALQDSQVRIAISLADLNTKAASLPNGSLIAMTTQDYTPSSAGYISTSVWYVDAGKAYPLVPLSVTLPATLTYLAGLIGAGKTYANLLLIAYGTTAVVGSGVPRDEWIWVGATTKWMLWRGATNVNFVNGFQADGRLTGARFDGAYCEITFAAAPSSGTTPVVNSAPVNVVGLSVDATSFISGGLLGSAGWAASEWYVNPSNDSQVYLLTAPPSGTNTMLANGRVRRSLPGS